MITSSLTPGLGIRVSRVDQRCARAWPSSASSRLAASRRVLGRLVEQPRRQLDEASPGRVPVLADQQQPLRVVEGDDGDRPLVRQHIALEGAAVGVGEPVAANPDDRAGEHLRALGDRPVHVAVGDRSPSGRRFDRRTTQAGLVDRKHQLALAVQRGRDEATEERVRTGRSGPQLGVGLGGDVVGVDLARQLDELDQLSVG